MGIRCLAGGLILGLLSMPASAAAEWQIKPFAGITFAGNTTFIDLEKAAGRQNFVYGATVLLLGEVIGVDGDVGRAPGFFEAGGQELLLGSSVTTLTGNVVIALPRRMSEYTLRPYFVGGGGLMHVQIQPKLGALQVSRTLPAADFGFGATGFLNERVGVSWEARRFISLGGNTPGGVSFGDERLSFWRVNMAVAFRY